MGNGIRVIKILIGVALVLATMSVAAQDRGLAAAGAMTYDADIMRQLPPPAPNQDNSEHALRNAVLWTGSVSWEQSTQTVEYRVDKSLSASVIRHYFFHINPKFQSAKTKAQLLRSGYYLMRMVVLRPLGKAEEESLKEELGPLKPEYILYRRYVTSTEQLVRAQDGVVPARVSLEFPAISAIAMKTTLLIQFLPVDPKSVRVNPDGGISRDSKFQVLPDPTLSANVIKIPFVPRDATGMSRPPAAFYSDEVSLEEKMDLGGFISLSKSYSEALKKKHGAPLAPRTLADRLNLTYYLSSSPTLNSLMVQPSNPLKITPQQALAKLESLDPGVSTLSEEYSEPLCRLLTNHVGIDSRILGHSAEHRKRNLASFKQIRYSRCVLDPEGAFDLIRTWHVKNSSSAVVNHDQGMPTSLALSFNFGTNRQKAVDTFKNMTGGINLLSFVPVDLKGFGNFGWNWSINESNSRAKFEGAILSGTVNLAVDEFTLPVEMSEFTSCTLLLPHFKHVAWSFAETRNPETAGRGIYICYPGVERRLVRATEDYYHVQPVPTASSSLDIYDPRNQLNMVVRGQRDYSFFLKSIREFMVPIHSDGKTAGTEIKARAAAFRSAVPAMNSVITAGVKFSGPKLELRQAQHKDDGLVTRFFNRRTENFD